VIKNQPPIASFVSVRRLLLLGVFAVTALQYLYADTVLTIVRLPALIVFAAVQ
jgi:hypothetical protein